MSRSGWYGNLLDDRKMRFELSESARNFRDKLIRRNPVERPIAANALEDDWFKKME